MVRLEAAMTSHFNRPTPNLSGDLFVARWPYRWICVFVAAAELVVHRKNPD
jgi:hypothetical protein